MQNQESDWLDSTSQHYILFFFEIILIFGYIDTQMSLVNLTINDIVIESRASDKIINAMQLCKTGGKNINYYSIISRNIPPKF